MQALGRTEAGQERLRLLEERVDRAMADFGHHGESPTEDANEPSASASRTTAESTSVTHAILVESGERWRAPPEDDI